MRKFALLTFLMIAAPAAAAPITGSVTLSQSFAVCPNADCVLPVNGAGQVVALADSIALDFTSTGAPSINVAGPMSIDGGTGTFAGIVGTGTIKDFCFVAGSCGVYQYPPIASWQLSSTGASFDMLTVTNPFKSNDALTLTGTGLFHIAGFDNTPGTFSLAVTHAGTAFSFSATDTAVPEPASMALFGLAMLGGVPRLLRRRR